MEKEIKTVNEKSHVKKTAKKSAKKVSKKTGKKVVKKTVPTKNPVATVSKTGRTEPLDVMLSADRGAAMSVKEQIARQKANRSNILIRGVVREGKGAVINPESGGYKIVINPISIDRDMTKKLCKNIFNRWQSSESSYKRLFSHFQGDLTKIWGRVEYISVQSDTVVASCVCLDENGDVNYDAFNKSIKDITEYAKYNSGSVHIERFGDWDSVATILDGSLVDYGVSLYIY